MKNLFKWFGIIALTAIIVFSLTGCDFEDLFGDDSESGGGGGTFTLTDIPSKYNGMYAGFIIIDYGVSSGQIACYESSKGDTYTLSKIKNGSVKMPVWNGTGKEAKGYGGNITITYLTVRIYESEKVTYKGYLSFAESNIGHVRFDEVKFKGGSVTKSWEDGNDGLLFD